MMLLAMMLGLTSAQNDAPREPGPKRPTSERRLAELFTSGDYPAGALRRGAEGMAHFRLHVGADGALRACKIVESSGDADLDRATCEIVRERGRFRPGRGADGNPTGGTIRARVVWRIEDVPERRGLPFAPTRTVSTMRFSTDGGASCSMSIDGALVWSGLDDDCSPRGIAPARPVPDSGLEMTVIETFVPDGALEQAPAATEPAPSELILESASRLTIAPDGRVAECRLVRRMSFRPRLGASAPDLCAIYARGEEPVFEPASKRGEIRFARVVVRFYQRSLEEP